MAGWIVNASGEVEDPSVVRSLFAELGEVLRKAEHGTGSSEFTSAHLSATNFHVQEEPPVAPGAATGAPGEEQASSQEGTGGFPPRP